MPVTPEYTRLFRYFPRSPRLRSKVNVMLHTSFWKHVRSGFAGVLARRRRSAKRSSVAVRRRSTSLRPEALEDRIALSTIVVNEVADKLFQAPTATVAVSQNPAARISLLDAINIANNSDGPDTIVLEDMTYKLDKVDNYWYGSNGLPAISSDITIEGNQAKIERTGGPNFRFFYVSHVLYGGLPTGRLTLKNLKLQGGVANGGDGGQGGGGLGAGGAIFNQGT